MMKKLIINNCDILKIVISFPYLDTRGDDEYNGVVGGTVSTT